MTGLEGADALPGALSVLVTVVIACRDGERTLGAQLAALAAQVVPFRWEVVVADNGSRDGSVALARSFADRLDLRVVDASARPGAGFARNVGAQVARGEHLAFCDADDVVAPGWLAALAGALERHGFVAGRFEGRLLNGRRALRSRALDQQDGLQRHPLAAGLLHAGAGNMGVRSDLFRSVGGFDPDVPVLEDTDLSWRLQQAGVPLVYVPEAVVHVRLRDTLPAMWSQGVAYGAAQALLEARLAARVPVAPSGSGEVVSAAPLPRPRRSAVVRVGALGARGGRVVRSLLADGVPTAGRLVWQLGWHVGHHRPV